MSQRPPNVDDDIQKMKKNIENFKRARDKLELLRSTEGERQVLLKLAKCAALPGQTTVPSLSKIQEFKDQRCSDEKSCFVEKEQYSSIFQNLYQPDKEPSMDTGVNGTECRELFHDYGNSDILVIPAQTSEIENMNLPVAFVRYCRFMYGLTIDQTLLVQFEHKQSELDPITPITPMTMNPKTTLRVVASEVGGVQVLLNDREIFRDQSFPIRISAKKLADAFQNISAQGG